MILLARGKTSLARPALPNRGAQRAFQRRTRRWELHAFVHPSEALEKIPGLHPDLLLLDTDLPDITGLDCARMLRSVLPRLPVIFIPHGVKPETVLWYQQLPAQGYLMKSVPAAELLDAVGQALRGLRTVCDRASELLLNSVLPEVQRAARAFLTERECQIMERVARGWRDKQIGAALGMASTTVHGHRTHAYRKLGAHGKQDAVHKYTELGQYSPSARRPG